MTTGFSHNWEAFMGSTEDPPDGSAVAQTVYASVFVYVAFIAFCGLQIGLNRRYSRIQI